MNFPDKQYDQWRLSSKYEDDERGCCDRCNDVLPFEVLHEVGNKVYCEYCIEKMANEDEEDE